MRISRRVRRSKWFKRFIAACLTAGMVNFTFLPAALALPQGGSVQWTNGSIDITNPALIKMLTGNGAIIDWNSFNIANGETVTFNFDAVQNGAVLNRVVLNNPSLIAGLLEATNNGKVVLVNPSGIVFGSGAQIDTGSFVASTIDITNDAFKKFVNGETNLLQFRPNGETSKGIEFTGDTYTNLSNTAFIGTTISVAPGVTISAGTPSSPIKDYGYIRLLTGKELVLSVSSAADGSNYMSVRNHTADANNTITIGSAAGGATIQAGGLLIEGGAINIEGSETNRSTIHSGDNDIFNTGFSIIALSERDVDTDYRQYNLENTVTIKNTNLVADNYNNLSEIIGGKVQITDSVISANGAFDIYARSAKQGDTIFAGSDNSLTLENAKINSNYDATIRGGKVRITDSVISSDSIVDVMAFSERYNPDTINTTTTANYNNSITLENVTLYGENSTKIRGGKLEIAESNIGTNGSLIMLAYSERESFLDNDGKDSYILSAGADNSITVKNTALSGGAYDGRATEIVGGKVEISGSTINTGDMNIVAANSLETNGDFSNVAAKAVVNNTLNINNSSFTTAGYSRLRGMGGAIDISGSSFQNYNMALAAFEEMKSDQRVWPDDTYFIGESTFKTGVGSTVTLRGNSSIIGRNIEILGNSIKVDGSSIAASGELGVSLNALNSRNYSDSKMVETSEHNSKNIIEIGNDASITSTNDNGEIMLLGGVISNNGTIDANKGSAGVIALVELKDNGTMKGSDIIKFSGKDMEVGDYDYTWQGKTLTITIEKDNPNKSQPTWEVSWDSNNNSKATVYLKSALPPEDIDKNTTNDEVMKSIDNALENAATKDEALQAIETIFANIQGKSDQDKKEIASHLMDTAKQQGLDETDVAKAVINGDGGEGTFTGILSEANNETSKENTNQQQSGEANVNGTTQLTQNNDQSASNNEISSGVSLEGEKLDDN